MIGILWQVLKTLSTKTMSKRRRKKLSANPITTNILRLSHEGRGIAEIEGKTTFIFGTLPNETITFRYTKFCGQYDEGEAIKIITASNDRVEPICPNFSICGGCSLQHMHHDVQITHKQNAVLSLLKNTPPETIMNPITANTEGYRRKARIGVKFVPKKEKVMVGFREKNAPYITNMDICYTLHPDVGKLIDALSRFFMTLECKSTIPQLEVAVADDATAIIVRHLEPLVKKDLQQLIDFFKARQWHLYLQPRGTDSIHKVYPADTLEHLHYFLPDEGLRFQFHPAQFTQINHEINEKMVARAIELLDLQKNDGVLDLFCGIGNFSLPVAKRCKQVIGVEGDETAVTQAKTNATLNHIENVEFHTTNLFEIPFTGSWSKQHYDKLLLDPPRTGAKEIAENIAQWEPTRIVYVSCNPATLARDAEILRKQGYHLKQAGIMDMFPHTQHVEAITLFEYE